MLDEFALQKTMYELNEKIKLILNLMNQPQKNKSQKTMSFDEYMKEAKLLIIFLLLMYLSVLNYIVTPIHLKGAGSFLFHL